MKKKKSWRWLIIVVILVVAVGGALVLQRVLRTNVTGLSTQQYESAKVAKGDIKVTVHGTGSIEAMDTSTVTSAASAKVDSVLVENGDTVKKGQLIAKLNADDVNSRISSLKDQITAQDATIASMRSAPAIKTLYAPVDARVKAIYAKEGDDTGVSMSAYGALMLLSTDGKMKLSFVPASGVALKGGDAVKVTIGSTTLDGYISTIPDSTTDEAVAVIYNDKGSVGAEAVVKNASGVELGRGTLEVNQPLLITVDSGTVDHLYVKKGDKVSKGNKLVRLTGYILDPNFSSQIAQRQKLVDDLNTAYDDLKDLNITAPADGIVTGLTLQENAMAQDGTTVCTIQETTGFKLVVAVDELDIPGIKIGQKADVKIDALPGQAATGEVTKISSIGDKANDVTTYDVTLQVNAPAGALANMSASADIDVASKSGVLLVPVEALHSVNGKTFVYGALAGDLNPDATGSPAGQGNGGMFGGMLGRMRGASGSANSAKQQRQSIEVTVGLISDSYAEILSGLNEGDEIAVPVAQDSSANMFSFGGGRQNSGSSQSSQPSPTGGAGNGQS
jgi:HlyD family secretion protein